MKCMNTSARKQHKKDNYLSSKKTLDIQHLSKLDDLDHIHKEISSMEAKISKIDSQIAKCLSEFKQTNDDNVMDRIISLKDEKLHLAETISKLQDENNYLDYYLNTSDILYKYYDMVENGGVAENVAFVKVNENSILNWFSSSQNATDDQEDVDKNVNNKAMLIDKYLQQTNKNYINPYIDVHETCSYCNSSDTITITAEGYIECNACHSIEHIIVDHEKPSYKDPPKEISYWAYKRINHFRLILEWNSILILLVLITY